MPKHIFTDAEFSYDYGAIDTEALLRMGDDGFADVYPPPGGDQAFDDQFERRAQETQRLPSNIQPVQVVELRNGAWSGNNQLGNEIAFSPNANNEQTILKLDEWGFPEYWTVCLGLNNFTPTIGGFDVTALIQFGAGGIVQEVEVDWLNGSAITLPLNALNVIAKYNFFDGEIPGDPPIDLRLRVSICKGSVNNARPTRTTVFTKDTLIIPIPAFAKALHLAPLADANAFTFYSQAVKADFITNDGVAVGITNYLFSQFVTSINDVLSRVGAPKTVPIPPFARFVQFTAFPNGADAPQKLVAQFLIGL